MFARVCNDPSVPWGKYHDPPFKRDVVCRCVGDGWKVTWRCPKCGRWQIDDDQELEPGKDSYERFRVRPWKKKLKPSTPREYTFKCGCDSHHPLRKDGDEAASDTGCGNMFKASVEMPPTCHRDGEPLPLRVVA